MGRTATKNLNLPPHIRARVRGSKTYYFYDAGGKPRKEIALGQNYIEAVKKWTELEGRNNKSLIYFKDLAERYKLEVIPTKSLRTQSDNIAELENLLKFFNNPPAPVTEIKPSHVHEYLMWRTNGGKKGTTRANREKALLSNIFNKARAWGVLDTVNPCSGVSGFTELGRTVYIEDEVFDAVYKVSSQPLKDALDLAYLTGQRPGDTVAMKLEDIHSNELLVTQRKTKMKIRMEIIGQLKEVVARILKRKESLRLNSTQLICNENGGYLSQNALRQRFVDARAQAANSNSSISAEILNFQFRDLRAKAASDKAESGTLREAQLQLGHKSLKMTEHYVRVRKGQKVTPTK